MVRVSRKWLLTHVDAVTGRDGDYPKSPKSFFAHIRAHPVPKGGYMTDLSDMGRDLIENGDGFAFKVRVPNLPSWAWVRGKSLRKVPVRKKAKKPARKRK